MAPITWASVIDRIMAAPALVSPVSARATSAKATGPAACGTVIVAEEMNHRMSGAALVVLVEDVVISRPEAKRAGPFPDILYPATGSRTLPRDKRSSVRERDWQAGCLK
jgi:hypothetical protein